MNLPEDLQEALNHKLETVSTKRLSTTTDNLSRRYRTRADTLLRSREDVIAYAAYRLPATFAAVYAALYEAQKRQPAWQPCTLLDVGAGPGTAMWAAVQVWPELERFTLLDRDQHMLTLGKELALSARSLAIKNAQWQQADLTSTWETTPHNLVVAAYMLGEMPQAAYETFINQLWSCTIDTLILIEPGTPHGFSLIRRAREQLLSIGAITVAPCPHSRACPISENDWCHFAQRINRTKLHRSVKGGTLSYEDEKFSYVALSRSSGTPIKGRVIRHPQKRSGHVHLDLCTPDGLQHTIISRSNHEMYREAQDAHWGSCFPSGPSPTTTR